MDWGHGLASGKNPHSVDYGCLHPRWSHHVLAGAYLRNRQYENTLTTLDELEKQKLAPAAPDLDSWLSQILNDSLRAIALTKLNRTSEARQILAQVQESSDLHLRITPELPYGEITPFWWNWYSIRAFRGEAEKLLSEADSNDAKK